MSEWEVHEILEILKDALMAAPPILHHQYCRQLRTNAGERANGEMTRVHWQWCESRGQNSSCIYTTWKVISKFRDHVLLTQNNKFIYILKIQS